MKTSVKTKTWIIFFVIMMVPYYKYYIFSSLSLSKKHQPRPRIYWKKSIIGERGILKYAECKFLHFNGAGHSNVKQIVTFKRAEKDTGVPLR